MFRCAICLEQCPQGARFQLTGCPHAFCRECITTSASGDLRGRQLPRCPSCVVLAGTASRTGGVQARARLRFQAQGSGAGVMAEADVRRLLGEAGLQQYHQASLLTARQASPGHFYACPGAGCGCVVDMGGCQDNARVVECPACGLRGCSSCQQQAHPGRPCPAATLDPGMAAFYRRNRTIPCPGCGHGLQHNGEGCYRLRCAKCGTHVCWRCGEQMPGWRHSCPDEALAARAAAQGYGLRQRVVDLLLAAAITFVGWRLGWVLAHEHSL